MKCILAALSCLAQDCNKVKSSIRCRGYMRWNLTPTCLESLHILLDFWGCLLHNFTLPILEFQQHEGTVALGPRWRIYVKLRE